MIRFIAPYSNVKISCNYTTGSEGNLNKCVRNGRLCLELYQMVANTHLRFFKYLHNNMQYMLFNRGKNDAVQKV